MANRPKVTEPVTNNKQRAREANQQSQRRTATAGPSRAKEAKTGGGHEKKPSKAPK